VSRNGAHFASFVSLITLGTQLFLAAKAFLVGNFLGFVNSMRSGLFQGSTKRVPPPRSTPLLRPQIFFTIVVVWLVITSLEVIFVFVGSSLIAEGDVNAGFAVVGVDSFFNVTIATSLAIALSYYVYRATRFLKTSPLLLDSITMARARTLRATSIFAVVSIAIRVAYNLAEFALHYERFFQLVTFPMLAAIDLGVSVPLLVATVKRTRPLVALVRHGERSTIVSLTGPDAQKNKKEPLPIHEEAPMDHRESEGPVGSFRRLLDSHMR
jgi:hypothetical protein